MNDLQVLLATILGSLLVLVAIWLIAVRRDSGRNHIKTPFGELDLSTPGLAVLVVGAGLLLAPALVPHRPGGLPTLGWISGDTVPAPTTGSSVLQQQTVTTEEQEPNDRVGAANRIGPGQTIAGSVGGEQDRLDYFAFSPPSENASPMRIIVRTRSAGPTYGAICCVGLSVWNEKEEQIVEEDGYGPGDTISALAPVADAYIIRIASSLMIDYELVVREENL